MRPDNHRYGQCSWNRNGDPEDPERCVDEVFPDWTRSCSWASHQCRRKRGHGPGGLYCKQHAKEARGE